jgi:hypothetical protein
MRGNPLADNELAVGFPQPLDPRPILSVGLCLKNQNVMCILVCSRPCFILLSAYVGPRGRGLESEASFLCVGLSLKNQNVMCTLIGSRLCLVLLSAYVGARIEGLGSEASF